MGLFLVFISILNIVFILYLMDEFVSEENFLCEMYMWTGVIYSVFDIQHVVLLLNVDPEVGNPVRLQHMLHWRDYPHALQHIPPELLPILHHFLLIVGAIIAWGSKECSLESWQLYVAITWFYHLLYY